MSRARHQESLNAVQLFPFVAVLLCTMGSLLVLLVAVSRTSRVQAEQRVAETRARAVEAPPVDEKMRVRLQRARQHLALLKKQEALAKEHLQGDQRQLSHLEDHMRRLQTELESLRTAAAEMNSLEKTHFDDREQGQRELERLRELINDRTQAIAELKKEKSARRAYAVIPFKTPGGTLRPPVYFECKRDLIILQPEEIRFTLHDFRGPLGAGTPVTAAFRAAREHLIRQAGVTNPTEEAEPYALVIIRPEGRNLSEFLLENLDKAGIAFGYEVIESDAEIQYPPADPQLLAAELQAVETARGRIATLAVAAPHLYETVGGKTFDFSPENYEESEPLTSESHGTQEGRTGRRYAVDGIPNAGVPGGASHPRAGQDDGDDEYVVALPTGAQTTEGMSTRGGATGTANKSQGGSGGAVGMGSGPDGEIPTGSMTGFGGVRTNQNPGGSPQLPGGAAMAATNSAKSGAAAGNATSGTPAFAGQPAPPGAANAAGQPGASGTASSGPVEFGNYNPHAIPVSARVNDQLDHSGDDAYGRGLNRPVSDNAGETQIHSPDPEDVVQQRKKTKSRGKDWAIRSRKPGSVPIRRTIHVEVRGDQLAILPEHGANDEAGVGRKIPLAGPTYVAGEDISDALEKHIKAWGMAGEGLYWRPVIEVSVSADGQGRAKDLSRMLKNSGIEMKAAAVAQNSEGETSSASR